MSSHPDKDPFNNGIVIKDRHRFIGREEELNEIFSGLNNDQPASFQIVGERRIGK